MFVHTARWQASVHASVAACNRNDTCQQCMHDYICRIACYSRGAVHSTSAAPPTPQTVTQVLGVGSFDRPPMRRSRRSDVHTRSHVKLGSVPSSGLQGGGHMKQAWSSSCADFQVHKVKLSCPDASNTI